MRRLLIASLIAAVAAFAACFDSPDPLYCDEDTPCTDPERPFCDLTGQYPASDGQGRTCIPDPGAGDPDGGLTCEVSSECPSESPICDESCRACSANAECEARGGSAPFCSEAGSCVACLESADCTAAEAPVCEAGACRGCRSHGECGTGACELEQGACVAATDIVYVSPSGADVPDCGDSSTPCQTIGAALSLVTESRRWLVLAAGTYAESVTINGLDVSLIGPPEAVIQPPGGARGLGIEGEAVVVVDGLTVDSAISGAQGILCAAGAGPSPTLTVRNARVTNNNGVGIEAIACTLTVEQSTVSGNDGGGISIQNAGFRVLNNFIVGNGNPLSSTRGGVVINGDPPGEMGVFAFNTVAENGSATELAPGVECAALTQALAFSSNILYGNEGDAGVQARGNCSWSYSLVEGGVAGAGNIDADPRFVNPEEGNFHIEASSPAVDAADPAATLETDADGDARPQGEARDIGADEVAGG